MADQQPSPRPDQVAETTPKAYLGAVGDAWFVETMMQVQGTLTELKIKIDHLADQTKAHGDRLTQIAGIAERVTAIAASVEAASSTLREHGKELGHIGRIIFAGKILGIFIGIPLLGAAGFFIPKYWDGIVRMLGWHP